MSIAPPRLGLLLDVDGPLASPVTREVSWPIIHDLSILAEAGVPIAFITGRSLAFIRDQVVAELLQCGLAPTIRMYGVCEKGAVWFPITDAGIGRVEVDEAAALPTTVVEALRELVRLEFADTMFFDETKVAMVSVEQREDVAHSRYRSAQTEFNRAAYALCAQHRIGVQFDDQSSPDEHGRIEFRVEPTIISTDIESITLDKDRAAQRALAFFAQNGPLPELWRSVGDSRSDYLMADHLHSVGHDVAHIDVRPTDGVQDRQYRVISIGDQIHDEAGATFLSYWVEKLGLR